MKYEPILKVRIQTFKDQSGYDNIDENTLFELFVNDLILNTNQPRVTFTNSSLLESTSVGGADDSGIDGLAIKVNDFFVSSKEEIQEILTKSSRITVEFIFIQSKYKSNVETGEYSKFVDGIVDFLSSNHYEPTNEKITTLLELKDYLFSDEVMVYWKEAPSVKTYFAKFGEWLDDPHFNAKMQSLKERINAFNNYGDVYVRNLGASDLIELHEESKNIFEIVIDVLGTLEFEKVDGIDNSLVMLCKGDEFLKLLVSKEGLLRRSLFSDNVRDFQGDTEINKDIYDTIKTDPDTFLLKNNGITIVCSRLVGGNRKVTISNPQIVNGCQTSSVLFAAMKNGADLSKISVLVKIIATEESKITNSIVKGTNSQNHVLPETFEITRDFHKKLEEFVSSYQNTFSPYEKIYYERRSGQYDGDKDIKKHRIFGLEVLTKSVLSCFFQRPHECVYHITKLLNLYKNSIFIDEQSMLPYYTSALVCLNFERLIKKGLINPKFDKFKYQIISLIGETVNNQVPDLLNKKVDSYCEQIIKIARNEELFLKIVMKCIYAFEGSVTKWIEKYGQEYHRAIKDNRNFTKFMLVNTRGGNVNKLSFEPSEQITKVGKVLFTKQDKNGLYYGFISAEPDNIFFHQKDNPKLDYDNIEGMLVTYEIGSNAKNGKEKALNISLK